MSVELRSSRAFLDGELLNERELSETTDPLRSNSRLENDINDERRERRSRDGSDDDDDDDNDDDIDLMEVAGDKIIELVRERRFVKSTKLLWRREDLGVDGSSEFMGAGKGMAMAELRRVARIDMARKPEVKNSE
ncbi:hypothetical protein H0H87_009575 [Tephrocybe sp. NHM501043]|nr:hypothetical protein H0H87_009575 [Tephrocybe sp. NHM501043]